MSCGLANPDGNLLCLAHSNALEDGRGAYHKTDDLYGAIVCMTCHDEIDGRRPMAVFPEMAKLAKRDKHHLAWVKTMRWWIQTERIKPA